MEPPGQAKHMSVGDGWSQKTEQNFILRPYSLKRMRRNMAEKRFDYFAAKFCTLFMQTASWTELPGPARKHYSSFDRFCCHQQTERKGGGVRGVGGRDRGENSGKKEAFKRERRGESGELGEKGASYRFREGAAGGVGRAERGGWKEKNRSLRRQIDNYLQIRG